MVPTTSGPPIAAPTAMSSPRVGLPNTAATRVTMLSGSAVPAAARTVPTASGPPLSSTPSHSMALMNHSQAREIVTAQASNVKTCSTLACLSAGPQARRGHCPGGRAPTHGRRTERLTSDRRSRPPTRLTCGPGDRGRERPSMSINQRVGGYSPSTQISVPGPGLDNQRQDRPQVRKQLNATRCRAQAWARHPGPLLFGPIGGLRWGSARCTCLTSSGRAGSGGTPCNGATTGSANAPPERVVGPVEVRGYLPTRRPASSIQLTSTGIWPSFQIEVGGLNLFHPVYVFSHNGYRPVPVFFVSEVGMKRTSRTLVILAAGVGLLGTVLPASAAGAPFLTSLTTVSTVASTVPGNGDVNPYGVAVVPRSTVPSRPTPAARMTN